MDRLFKDITVIRPKEVSIKNIIHDYIWSHDKIEIETKKQFLELLYKELVPELKGNLTEQEEMKCYHYFLGTI